MILTLNESPPGRHSVRIVASSSGGEDTVPYTISNTKTGVSINNNSIV